MTGEDLLYRARVLDNELQVSAGGADETRVLAALDMAQDAWQSIVASEPRVMQTYETVQTVANQMFTTWPTGLMRIDRAFMLDTSVTPARQSWEIDIVYETGANDPAYTWPLSLGIVRSSGGPSVCYPQKESQLNWGPLPDAVYSTRFYGFWAKTPITSRAITFGYPREVSVPLVALANRMLSMGIDDPSEEVAALANEFFTPVIKELRRYTRSKPEPRKYSRVHFT